MPWSRLRSARPSVTLVGQLDPVPVLVHCCAADPPIELLRTAGVRGVLIDIDQLTTADWDAIGQALESGLLLGLGARPTGRRAHRGPAG